MNIEKNDLVLEIGSGDRPYPRSDVLCDRYVTTTRHRQPGAKIVIDRPFVTADGERLPFKDKAFDYIITSHIVEHVDHPDLFLREIQRVGRKGYLAFPKPLLERFYNAPPHKWYCDWDGKKIILIKKTAQSRRIKRTKVEVKIFGLVMRFFPRACHADFEWSNKIQCKILKEEPAGFLENLDQEIQMLKEKVQKLKTPLPLFLYMKDKLFSAKLETSRFLQWLYFRSTRKVNLFPILACPYCHFNLTRDTGKNLYCKKCSRTYHFLKNVFYFL